MIAMVMSGSGMDAFATQYNEEFHLNYLVVESNVVYTPGSLYVLADAGDGETTIEEATIAYQNVESGMCYESGASKVDGSTLLFELSFDETYATGKYQITGMTIVSGDTIHEVDMATAGVDAFFGVNQEVDTDADAYVVDESQSENTCEQDGIEVLDGDGNAVSVETLTQALEMADEQQDDSELLRSGTNKNLVVVLDPGHGGTDSGAVGHGLKESDLCLKIANYCKAKLEEYSHVEVYMTRTTDTYVGLSERVAFAETKNPDVFVCIHINAGGGRGAEVYYPNGNYIPGIGTEGKELAQVIQDKLVALGLANRGIKIRNSENGSTYPDGSAQDYLNVIWRSKRAGFPAVLVEHAFIDNASDVNQYLSHEDKLKDMGIADAEAIAQYYGLSKNSSYGSKVTIADTIRDATEGATNEELTPIMNNPSTTVDKMVEYYQSKAVFPDYYKTNDSEIAAAAEPLRAFCQIYYDESMAEGVDPGVSFAQAMKETGFLKFGGDVEIGQYNFCGLGATGNGAKGNSFSSVRLGVRAQVQHLKAYASIDALNQTQVDPRFTYVTRGCAPYVEYLGIQENPFGKGWATSKNYGYSIVNDYMASFCMVNKQTGNSTSSLQVIYSTHIQKSGWQNEKINGVVSGTTGLGRRLEAIKIKMSSAYQLGITYQTHVQSYGWGNWASDGTMSGTENQSKRLEAIRIKLTGADADKFDVYYRVHAQTFGWLGWAKNGETAGTSGFSKRLEAIQIYVVPKGISPISGTEAVSYVQYGKSASNGKDAGLVNYATHVQTYGDQSYVYDGSFAGTYGEKKRLEAIRINVNTNALGVAGGIEYSTHVQSIGWQDWVSDDALTGTTGQSKRLEAIKIRLTGELAEQYDVYYRVHAQSYGWMNWTKNGESAGTEGFSKRLEGIQIVLVPKGGTAPASAPLNDERAFVKK